MSSLFQWAGALAEEAAEEVVEEVAKKDPTWLEDLVSKYGKVSGSAWIMFGVLAALGCIVFVVSKTSRKWNAKSLSYASLSIVLSFVLSCLRLYRMPTGGSITPGSMLPIMLFSVVYGVGPGMLTGLVYGVLQFLQAPEFMNVWQFLLDYLVAFSALGLAGIAKKKPDGLRLYGGILLAGAGRAVSATLAGVMWANSFIAEGWNLELNVFGKTVSFGSPWFYSVVYNGCYLLGDVIICMILAFLIAKPVMRAMKA